VALQEQDEELVKNQHDAQNVLKTGEALLADGNSKLTSALKAKDFQMASLAQAVIEAGQKKCKAAREQLEVIESKKKNVNCKRKQIVASASEPSNKKHGVAVMAVSNTGKHKTTEEHVSERHDKSSAKHKQKPAYSMSVRRD
jgi:hypothetical protein